MQTKTGQQAWQAVIKTRKPDQPDVGDTKGAPWEALYHLAIVIGMRQSELLGLKWTDLDWVRKYLKVER